MNFLIYFRVCLEWMEIEGVEKRGEKIGGMFGMEGTIPHRVLPIVPTPIIPCLSAPTRSCACNS